MHVMFEKQIRPACAIVACLASSMLLAEAPLADENSTDQVGVDRTQPGTGDANPIYASFKNGVTLSDGRGDWSFVVNGRVQADYRQFSPNSTAADTFSVRRARLGGTLTLHRHYTARIEGDYAGSKTAMTYGYIEGAAYAPAKIRAGQFKPLYGLERSTSTNFTDFQERSMADALQGGTYDRGIMVHGAPLAGLSYSLAYVNGSGTIDETNAAEDGKDVTARLTANLAEFMHWHDSVVHLGGFWATGSQPSRLSGLIPTGRTEGRGLKFFSTTCAAPACGAAALSNAFADGVDRNRAGVETAFSHGPVKLQSEYIRVSFNGPGYRRGIDAWYASAVWNLTGEPFAAMYKNGVFGRLEPHNRYKSGDGGWGAVQIGMRYTEFDTGDFKTTDPAGTGVLLDNPSGTSDGLLVATDRADGYTLGINWILNPNVRLTANWVHTEFSTPVTVRVNGVNSTFSHEDALTFRGQIDF